MKKGYRELLDEANAEIEVVSPEEAATLLGDPGTVFVDLRDRSGICQIVFRPEVDPAGHEKAKQIRSEDVIAVRGTLAKRSAETINEDLATGEVELVCHELRLLNASAVPPFIIEDETDASENTRLKYLGSSKPTA